MTRWRALLSCIALAGCAETRGSERPSAAGGAASVAGAAAGDAAAGTASGQATAGTPGHSSGGGSRNDGEPLPVAGAGGKPDVCDFSELTALDVFSPSWDPLGYPPYAIDGCQVVYVASEAEGGALYHIDLATAQRTLLDAAELSPRRPVIAGDVIAWERDGADGKSAVRVRTTNGEHTFESSGEPRAAFDAVVYTRFLGRAASDDTDVYLYRVSEAEEAPVAEGPGQQRFADVSATHVAVTDFSEDPRGYFDGSSAIADVVVIDRNTREAAPRRVPGKQAFPLLGNDGALVYLEWGAVHPEPKFSEFFLKAGRLGQAPSDDVNLKGQGPVSTDVAYVRPSLSGSWVDFIDRTGGVRLYSVSLSGTEAPTPVVDVAATQLLGPVSSERVTLVAAPVNGQSLRLVAFAR